jgi:ABC-2 type transport system ATP-binding protein
MQHMAALSLRRVSKAFPGARSSPGGAVKAVDDISLEVPQGEIFGVLGANGSGKSTLIRLVSTLLIPDAGAIDVFGLDIERHERQVKRLINRVSVVPLGLSVFRAAERYAKRTGKLKRSG